MVMFCVLLDKLDGTTARLLKAGSELGIQLDSLADFVSFNVAPAVIYGTVLTTDSSPLAGTNMIWTAYAAAVVYTIGGALRLAKFNCIEAGGGGLKSYFRGCPTTFAGAFLAILAVVVLNHELLDYVAVYLPAVLVLLGIAMVSPFYLPKLEKRRSRFINWIAAVHLVVVPVLIISHKLPEYLLFLIVLYAVVGFGVANRKGVEIK